METVFDKGFYTPDTPLTPKKGRWREPQKKSLPRLSPARGERWHEDMLDALIAARLKRHLTQKQLARLLGSTQSWISSFENGRVNPSLGFLLKYTRILGKKLTITIS